MEFNSLVCKLLFDDTYGVIQGPDIVKAVLIPAYFNNKKVTTILANAFKDNTTIQSIAIPNTITAIEKNAFEGCTSLRYLVIPPTVIRIDEYAFKNCSNLAIVYKSEKIPDGWHTTCFEGVKTVKSELEEQQLPEWLMKKIKEAMKENNGE